MGTMVEEREELDLRVRCGLLGTAEEQKDAIVLLFKEYKRPLMAYLRKNFPELPADDLASAVQDTFIAADENKQKLGETNQPLSRFLFTVANRRGIDARRKRACRIQTDDELTDEIGRAIESTLTKLAWDRARTANRTGEIIEEFRAFVPTLKGRQRMVAAVFADYMPYLLSDREIAEEIYTRTKLVISAVEVKGARAAMLEKFRELLERCEHNV
jgi:DNA-directed RNA polymerase specialized sigma24 family protein